MTGNLNMNHNKIFNIPIPDGANQPATKHTQTFIFFT